MILFNPPSIPGFTLDTGGIVALSDIKAIVHRTALTGSAAYSDIFFITPGIHRQQDTSKINQGEYPIAGSLSTGHVFQIQNQATVSYLTRVGVPGKLVYLYVSSPSMTMGGFLANGVISFALYLCGIALTIIVAGIMGTVRDWWGLGLLGLLILARLINVVIIKRRTRMGWKRCDEVQASPTEEDLLLVLLSEDRWVQMQGYKADIKAVTANQWLRNETPVETFGSSLATLLVFVSSALAPNMSTLGKILLFTLLLVSATLLGLSNMSVTALRMFNRTIYQRGQPQAYEDEHHMVTDLIEKSGSNHWAIKMGLLGSQEAAHILRSSFPSVPAFGAAERTFSLAASGSIASSHRSQQTPRQLPDELLSLHWQRTSGIELANQRQQFKASADLQNSNATVISNTLDNVSQSIQASIPVITNTISNDSGPPYYPQHSNVTVINDTQDVLVPTHEYAAEGDDITKSRGEDGALMDADAPVAAAIQEAPLSNRDILSVEITRPTLQ